MVGGCGARAVSRKTPIYFILGVKFLQLYDHFEIQMSLGRKYTAPLAGTLSYSFLIIFFEGWCDSELLFF